MIALKLILAAWCVASHADVLRCVSRDKPKKACRGRLPRDAGQEIITWCVICYFTSPWCVIYQLDFCDKWTFFDLEGYHSFKVNSKKSLKEDKCDTIFWSFLSYSWSFMSLILEDIDLLVKLCTRTKYYSVMFVHFVDGSVSAVHQTLFESS